jgi:hypothetical protein
LRCENCNLINRTDLRELLRDLLHANADLDEGILLNSRALTFLFFQMLRLSSEKHAFEEVKRFYPMIIKSLGYDDIVVLLLLSEASSYRNILPDKEIMEGYLLKDIPYETASDIEIYKLCELLDNYIRYD